MAATKATTGVRKGRPETPLYTLTAKLAKSLSSIRFSGLAMCSRIVEDKSTVPVFKSSEIHSLFYYVRIIPIIPYFNWKLIVSCLIYFIYRTINEMIVADDACVCVCLVDVVNKFDWLRVQIYTLYIHALPPLILDNLYLYICNTKVTVILQCLFILYNYCFVYEFLTLYNFKLYSINT